MYVLFIGLCTLYGPSTVNTVIFMKTLFLGIALKDIFATFQIHNKDMNKLHQLQAN